MSRPSALTLNATPTVGLHITIPPNRDQLSPVDASSLSPYTQIGCLDELLSASQIIDRWAQDRSRIVDQIHDPKNSSSPRSSTPSSHGPNVKDEGRVSKVSSDRLEASSPDSRPPVPNLGRGVVLQKFGTSPRMSPWQPWLPIFSKDRNCMSKLGWGQPPFAQRQVCAGCHAVTRMVPKKKMPESAMFQIGVGKYRGVILSVRTLSRDLVGYHQSLTPQRVGARLLSQLSHMRICEPSYAQNLPVTSFWETISGVDQYITVSCLIEQLMRNSKIPCEPIFRWAYSCGSDTIVIDETPSLGVGSLTNLTQNVDYLSVTPTAPTLHVRALKTSLIRGLVSQLVTCLHSLSAADFVHGEPSLASLGFVNKSTSYTYNGTNISCPVVLVIVPSSQSSISTVDTEGQRHRFYNAGKIMVKDLKGDHLPVQEIAPFLARQGTLLTAKDCPHAKQRSKSNMAASPTTVPEKGPVSGKQNLTPGLNPRDQPVHSPTLKPEAQGALDPPSREAREAQICVKDARSQGFNNPCLPELVECIVMGYRIGGCDELFTIYLRNLGVPLFQSSFDLYMFFTSLMAESVFYHGVIGDPVILNIWKNLWHPQEYETVMSSLVAFHHEQRVETPSFKDILTLLKPFILRCDALQNTWRQVREELEI